MAKSARYQYDLDWADSGRVADGGEEFHLSGDDAPPGYSEIRDANALRDVQSVADDLRHIDWAFTLADTQFLTHDVHPYPAKFVPQIPGHCIARLSLPGELVLDPFGGSGTTALEAVRLRRRAISIDANAVGTLIATVKTSNLDKEAVSDLRAVRSSIVSRIATLPPAPELCQQNREYIPEIPNIEKWFAESARGELALIRERIATVDSDRARNVCLLSLSRVVNAVSFQDSETRYSSKPRDLPQGETLRRYLAALEDTIRSVARTQPLLRYGVSTFVTADTRQLRDGLCRSESVDLIVTSPPYGNANDYHLYHRFRLLWLGEDPKTLAKVEIGSHLRHQKESSGFDNYLVEMRMVLEGMHRVLRPGRYAVLVVGDAVYGGVQHKSAEAIAECAAGLGLEVVCIIERTIHRTKRSFAPAGRRATCEKLLVLRKRPTPTRIWLLAPPYALWDYEARLRGREIESVLGIAARQGADFALQVKGDPYSIVGARRLVFTHSVGMSAQDTEPTWQAVLENGFARHPGARKDPKYVTHGLHPYKGKFYPQLAKGLMNLCHPSPEGKVLDPFCGSGTTLLEAYLNGLQGFGCDMNPLAAKIARAKVGILALNPDRIREALSAVAGKIDVAPVPVPQGTDQFAGASVPEIARWFPEPVMARLNWLLRVIRSVAQGVLCDFLEVVLSSVIREVSQQEPSDLRIRRRASPIKDADVFGLFLAALDDQYDRIERFWSVRGYSPNRMLPCTVQEGDSRLPSTFGEMGLGKGEVDLILTSPPYATALPYIDTDRLSLLVLFGMDSSLRRPVEHHLIGSREIATRERYGLENELEENRSPLPRTVVGYLQELHARVANASVGFRRRNMPALLLRFLRDMDLVLANCSELLRATGEAMVVIGDNRITVNGQEERIPTTDLIADLAQQRGLSLVERIDISVTTESLVHVRNAITQNVVLRLRPSGRLAPGHA